MNYAKTAILLILLAALFMWVGGMIGGQTGMIVAFILAMVINFGSYWFSDKIVLAMYKAQKLDENTYSEIYQIVAELAKKDNIPVPRIYLAAIDVPNAFATGRNPKNGVVCVTRGILNMLNREELKGVIAHEMSHIKHRDTLIMTVVAAIASAIMMMASMARWAAIFGGFGARNSKDRSGGIIGLLVVAIVAPLAAMLIQLAISRFREYAADENGAKLAGSANGLAAALRKLDQAAPRYKFNAAPQTAHLFIVNPLRGNFMADLFRTHPSTEKRIERLRAITKEAIL
ncbi:MAG: zinc metalloprotease HtpX [Candidatus Omnitrophica bacterium]|nr:zinc metalloprotease HtpX [Candidatus Omnitrophota bacterium]MBU4488942.1 zinc metalloprotease HtpX [Candidatus Omnitrophota bacterium]MCG2704511.1 zinc metalloprotease HtpX [Candidatus Omnitrophota bacterium]